MIKAQPISSFCCRDADCEMDVFAYLFILFQYLFRF